MLVLSGSDACAVVPCYTRLREVQWRGPWCKAILSRRTVLPVYCGSNGWRGEGTCDTSIYAVYEHEHEHRQAQAQTQAQGQEHGQEYGHGHGHEHGHRRTRTQTQTSTGTNTGAGTRTRTRTQTNTDTGTKHRHKDKDKHRNRNSIIVNFLSYVFLMLTTTSQVFHATNRANMCCW